MTIVNTNKCPNHICDGEIKIKYFFGDLNYKKINFNCTTDTYTKPSIYECTKCKIIFSFKIKQRLFKPKKHKLAEVVCGLQLK